MSPSAFSASNRLQASCVAPSPPDEGDHTAHEAIGGRETSCRALVVEIARCALCDGPRVPRARSPPWDFR
jgi:hypothetical protein